MKGNRNTRGILWVVVSLLVGVLVVGAARAAHAESTLSADVERFYHAGNYEQALEALQAEAGKNPQEPALHYWMGRCFYELRDYGKAISSLERAVALDPNNSEFHHELGRALGRKAEESNRFSAFLLARRTHRELESAVRLDKSNLAAHRDLIRYLLYAPGILGGGDDRALEQAAALALVDAVQADLARAEYFAASKKSDQAGEQYQKLLQSRHENAGVYLEIAEYYRDRGEAQGMQQALQAGAEIAPADQRLEYYRGVALVLAQQDPAGAERHLRTYLATVPRNSDFPAHSSAHEWLGKLYETQGKLDQAVTEYQAALSLDPRNKTLREGLKRIQRR